VNFEDDNSPPIKRKRKKYWEKW